MSESLPRVFLSYASQDADEVNRLDLELRRRGVPLWRDRVDLTAGRPSTEEIERAAREAAGFVFYLTGHAARSEWVRERERAAAVRNALEAPGCGIVPVFRAPMDEVSEEMIRLGTERPGSGVASPYDLRKFRGYRVDPRQVADGGLDQELAAAAEQVLRSLIATLAEGRSESGRLRMGAATRGGPSLAQHPLDLLVDWTAEYPEGGAVPTDAWFREHLAPALASLAAAVRMYWPNLKLQIVPRCHLTMALAVGFQFRRNTGADLEVLEINTGGRWLGPAVPGNPEPEAWAFEQAEIAAAGDELAVAIGISQSITGHVRTYLEAAGIAARHLFSFEPTAGSSFTALAGVSRETAHRMAAAVVRRVVDLRSRGGHRLIHLFLAGPAAFAVLLGQQLSNIGRIQTYEWLDAQGTYAPCFRLRTSGGP